MKFGDCVRCLGACICSTDCPEFPCNDCDVNTCPLEGDREYYEVQDYLWAHDARAPGIGQSDHGPQGFFLCIGCLESRLGRRVMAFDFKNFPANKPSPWLSDRLNDRLGGPVYDSTIPREFVMQFFPNALIAAVRTRFHPQVSSITPTGAYALMITGTRQP